MEKQPQIKATVTVRGVSGHEMSYMFPDVEVAKALVANLTIAMSTGQIYQFFDTKATGEIDTFIYNGKTLEFVGITVVG